MARAHRGLATTAFGLALALGAGDGAAGQDCDFYRQWAETTVAAMEDEKRLVDQMIREQDDALQALEANGCNGMAVLSDGCSRLLAEYEAAAEASLVGMQGIAASIGALDLIKASMEEKNCAVSAGDGGSGAAGNVSAGSRPAAPQDCAFYRQWADTTTAAMEDEQRLVDQMIREQGDALQALEANGCNGMAALSADCSRLLAEYEATAEASLVGMQGIAAHIGTLDTISDGLKEENCEEVAGSQGSGPSSTGAGRAGGQGAGSAASTEGTGPRDEGFVGYEAPQSGVVIFSENVASFDGTTLEACREACSGRSDCGSFEYHAARKYCALNRYSTSELYASEGYVFYRKKSGAGSRAGESRGSANDPVAREAEAARKTLTSSVRWCKAVPKDNSFFSSYTDCCQMDDGRKSMWKRRSDGVWGEFNGPCSRWGVEE